LVLVKHTRAFQFIYHQHGTLKLYHFRTWPLPMKRYEERLLEDLKSIKCSVPANNKNITNPPPIFRLPDELLLAIIEAIWPLASLKVVRYVSTRFARLARPELFRTLSFKTVPISRIVALDGYLEKHPWLGHRCRELQLRLFMARNSMMIAMPNEAAEHDRLLANITEQRLPYLDTLCVVIYPNYYESQSDTSSRESIHWYPQLLDVLSRRKLIHHVELSIQSSFYQSGTESFIFQLLKTFPCLKSLRIPGWPSLSIAWNTPYSRPSPIAIKSLPTTIPTLTDITYLYICSTGLLDLIPQLPKKFPRLRTLECVLREFKARAISNDVYLDEDPEGVHVSAEDVDVKQM
jgi:hypothetical protein